MLQKKNKNLGREIGLKEKQNLIPRKNAVCSNHVDQYETNYQGVTGCETIRDLPCIYSIKIERSTSSKPSHRSHTSYPPAPSPALPYTPSPQYSVRLPHKPKIHQLAKRKILYTFTHASYSIRSNTEPASAAVATRSTKTRIRLLVSRRAVCMYQKVCRSERDWDLRCLGERILHGCSRRSRLVQGT